LDVEASDLDLSDCFVDVIETLRASDEGIETLVPERLRSVARLFRGDFLEGFEIDRSPLFSGWLNAERGPPLPPANEVAARAAV
jgi:hypothetical protein